jgi:hypothetical protein
VALQQRVGRDGHAVREALDLLRAAPGALQRGLDRGDHALGLIGRGGGRLGGDQPTVDRQHRIGERPAHVDAKQHGSTLAVVAAQRLPRACRPEVRDDLLGANDASTAGQTPEPHS